MNKQHILDNASGFLIIRTFYGGLYLAEVLNATERSKSDPSYIGYVNTLCGEYSLYKINSSGYDASPSSPTQKEIDVISFMNLTDTIDFLKTLKTEKAKAS